METSKPAFGGMKRQRSSRRQAALILSDSSPNDYQVKAAAFRNLRVCNKANRFEVRSVAGGLRGVALGSSGREWFLGGCAGKSSRRAVASLFPGFAGILLCEPGYLHIP